MAGGSLLGSLGGWVLLAHAPKPVASQAPAQTLQIKLAPVLMLDNYLPFSPLQALIPFIAPPKPQWVGIGIISLYLTLFVTVTLKA